MDPLRGLLAAFRLRAGEAAVAGRDAPESPLARAKLGPRTVLDPLDLQLAMRVAEGTVTANTLGHLHGGATERRYRGELVFMGSWVCARKISACQMIADSSPEREPRRAIFRLASNLDA